MTYNPSRYLYRCIYHLNAVSIERFIKGSFWNSATLKENNAGVTTLDLSVQDPVKAITERERIEPSKKSYAVAVSLSAIFGVLGIHHFYLGRFLEGFLDLGLALLTYALFLSGQPIWAAAVFALDTLHTFIVTIMLLTGSINDGKGKRVCYPGQRLA